MAPVGGYTISNHVNGSSQHANDEEAHHVSTGSTVFYNTSIRHGFGVISEEWMNFLAQGFCNYFENKRHETGSVPKPHQQFSTDWRSADRQRTVNAALVLCLNLGVDPPDVIKTHPCAKLEAWVNPSHYSDSKKAIEQIGKNLQAQYESLSTRAKYKQSLDPTVEDVGRFCASLRRSARDDRILFHYNGHGVPRPTPSGEIWVFNRGYTKYIPVSVYELHSWLGSPVIYCFDCSGAGRIVRNFDELIDKARREELQAGQIPTTTHEGCIQMGACRADEILPMHPQLPADMFTCCITSPVDIAVKWFVMQHSIEGLDPSSITIPGKISDRRTPLGELNWIFTAITDTIAWSALDSALFKKLFRQDLVVAAMFRNFLLAVRIMRVYNCHPVSSPELPDTHKHPMWASWDLAVHHCLIQLPAMQKAEAEGLTYEYEHSDFFEQQLTAFEVWLKYKSTDIDHPPEQLPILLQVLLSQIHRLRALLLLSRYLDLGPKAIRIALSISFFIYVQKLLQSPAPELKPVLIFIWTRIMAVYYKDIQGELIKDNGYNYFVNILCQDIQETNDIDGNVNTYEYKAMCTFIIAQFCRNFRQGQRLCIQVPLYTALAKYTLEKESPLLRQWACLCFSKIWEDCPEAKQPVETNPEILQNILTRFRDPIPEVRAAAVAAITSYFSNGNEELAHEVVDIALDGSPIVRREVVIFFSKFVSLCFSNFLVCGFTTLEEEYRTAESGDLRSESPAHGTVALASWRMLLCLATDSFSLVREPAKGVVDYIYSKLAKSPLSHEVSKMAAYVENKSSENLPDSKPLNGGGPSLRPISSPENGSYFNASESLAMASPAHTFQSMDSSQTSRSIVGSAMDYVKSLWGSPSASLPNVNNLEIRRRPEMENYVPSAPTVGETGDSVSYKDLRLPLKSKFYEWSVEYFTEPQLHSTESEEPGSQKQLERLWRKQRNENILSETQVQKDLAVTESWNNPTHALKNSEVPHKLLFAQFEPHMITIDVRNNITVWDWQNGTRINQFNNDNIANTRATDARLLNEDDQPLLLTSATDGQVRVFRRYDSPGHVELVTSWWMLPDILPQHRNYPYCIDWHQSRGSLLVGGDFRVVRVWDAAREAVSEDIAVGTAARLTSLTSDQVTGNIFVAGFNDGSVNVYDRRQDKNALVARSRYHKGSILNVHMQRGGARELMSGSTDGTVNLWDIRKTSPVVSFQAHTKDMRAVTLHEHAPIIATASRVVGLWSTSGRRVATVRPPSIGYQHDRMGAVSALAFHPHRIMMAVNNVDDCSTHIFESIA